MNKAWWEPDEEPEVTEAPEPKSKTVKRARRTKLKGERPLQMIVDEVSDPGVEKAITDMSTVLHAHLEKRKQDTITEKVEAALKPTSMRVRTDAGWVMATGNITTPTASYNIQVPPIVATWSDPAKAEAEKLRAKLAEREQLIDKLAIQVSGLTQVAKHAARAFQKVADDLDHGESPRDALAIETGMLAADLLERAKKVTEPDA